MSKTKSTPLYRAQNTKLSIILLGACLIIMISSYHGIFLPDKEIAIRDWFAKCGSIITIAAAIFEIWVTQKSNSKLNTMKSKISKFQTQIELLRSSNSIVNKIKKLETDNLKHEIEHLKELEFRVSIVKNVSWPE